MAVKEDEDDGDLALAKMLAGEQFGLRRRRAGS